MQKKELKITYLGVVSAGSLGVGLRDDMGRGWRNGIVVFLSELIG